MPPAILSRTEVIARLTVVLRRQGFAGASLAELSKATGLGKSSLYHHFPDGKDDMTRAVLAQLAEQLEEALVAPLLAPGPARRRLETMTGALDRFYRGGREACLLANLVVGETRERFREELAAIFEEWIAAIAAVLGDAGFPRILARTRAEDAVVRIEGALVLAAGTGRAAVFERTLRQLPADLLAPAKAGRD